MAIMNYFSDLR